MCPGEGSAYWQHGWNLGEGWNPDILSAKASLTFGEMSLALLLLLLFAFICFISPLAPNSPSQTEVFALAGVIKAICPQKVHKQPKLAPANGHKGVSVLTGQGACWVNCFYTDHSTLNFAMDTGKMYLIS